jgi:hypothetical protein
VDPRAAVALGESLALAEAAQARYAMGHALMTLGDLHWRRGDVERAMLFWRRARRPGTARRSTRHRRQPRAVGVGLVAGGQCESAAWLFGASAARHRLMGMDLGHSGLSAERPLTDPEPVAITTTRRADASERMPPRGR